ncbi:MAG: hypothetical protein R3200_00400 [Xanthomonadales bacterium]|nr:hypothetical protein [Xanthomonadales bacterium]
MERQRELIGAAARLAASAITLGCLAAPLFASDLGPGVLARLGQAEVTQADVNAALLDVPADKRDGVMNSPDRVGNLLQTILLRRAIVADADRFLSRSEMRKARESAQEEALATLALEMIPVVNDERAIEQRARQLYEREAAAAARTVVSFDLITVQADAHGWDGAERVAAEQYAVLQAGDTVEESEGITVRRFQDVDRTQIADEFRERISDMQPGTVSKPYPMVVGYQILVYRGAETRPPPSFEDTRSTWMARARDDLAAAGRRELAQLHDEAGLADLAKEAGLDNEPTGAAYLRQAEEEALLAELKNAYFEEELQGDYSALVRERYVTSRAQHRTQPQADIALVRVRGMPAVDQGELREKLDSYVREQGLGGFDERVKALTGVPAVMASYQRQVPFKILRDSTEFALYEMLERDWVAHVSETDGIVSFVAMANYVPSRQKEFAEVEEDLMASVSKELREAAWRRFTDPYYKLELEADPEAIAALRVPGMEGG